MKAEMECVVGAVFPNFFFNWNVDCYVLLRIRVLTVFLIFLYFVTGIVSAVGRLNGLRVLDAVSENLLVYLMGAMAMQIAPFRHRMFPSWVIFLLSVRSTVDIISNYDTSLELKNMMKLWAAVLLDATHGSKSLEAPFWLFWGVLVVKSLYRIRARKLASKSLWHGRSSELVHEYMGAVDHKPSNLDAVTLEGCKFLVYGESENNMAKGISPSISNIKSVITLDTVWLHHGAPLARTINMEKNTIKDLTLAFALSRLLRCRMEGGKLHEDTISVTSKIICSRIIHDTVDDNDKNILDGILQMDLFFLVQHMHTGYHMVFSQRLRWLCFPILEFIVLQSTCIWLYLWIFWRVLDFNFHRRRITDLSITVVFITIISVMQILEVLRYVSSHWTRLLLVCNYMNWGSNNRCMEKVLGRMISSFPVFSSERLLVNFTSRYDFLRSSGYSKGKLRESLMSPDLKHRHSVIAAVFRALARYMDEERLPSHRLPAPRVSARAQPYWSACLRLPSCSHVILVLHIATNLCQLKLERDRGDTSDTTGLSRFFVRNTRADLGDNLSNANLVANCLSRNCLDLLISKPNLLPENVLASKKLLLDTIQHAHDILRGCKSPKSRYDELIALAREADVPPDGAPQDIKMCAKFLIQGAMMGKKLIESEDEESRWDILAELWADILVQIAPTSKMEAHNEALLQFRAPLVTLVWALLCHCGIEKSELWPEER